MQGSLCKRPYAAECQVWEASGELRAVAVYQAEQLQTQSPAVIRSVLCSPVRALVRVLT